MPDMVAPLSPLLWKRTGSELQKAMAAHSSPRRMRWHR